MEVCLRGFAITFRKGVEEMKVILIIMIFFIGLDIASISYNVRKIREKLEKE